MSAPLQMLVAVVLLVLLTMGTVSAIDHAVGTYGAAVSLERLP